MKNLLFIVLSMFCFSLNAQEPKHKVDSKYDQINGRYAGSCKFDPRFFPEDTNPDLEFEVQVSLLGNEYWVGLLYLNGGEGQENHIPSEFDKSVTLKLENEKYHTPSLIRSFSETTYHPDFNHIFLVESGYVNNYMSDVVKFNPDLPLYRDEKFSFEIYDSKENFGLFMFSPIFIDSDKTVEVDFGLPGREDKHVVRVSLLDAYLISVKDGITLLEKITYEKFTHPVSGKDRVLIVSVCEYRKLD